MSMPDIPDITPEINITLEDSINLLLTSIAMEENSISKLMDAEKDKILFIQNKYENNEAEIGDVLDVNNSVNKTIIDLIKMQMLLQFKLEDVEKLIPTTSTSTSTTTSSSTTTTTHSRTTTSTTSTCSTTTKCPKFECCLKGKSKGVVLNKSDAFYCCNASLKTCLSRYQCKENTIVYFVGNCCNSLYLKSNGNNIEIEYPYNMQPGIIKIRGRANLTKIVNLKETDLDASFKLFLWLSDAGKSEFKIEIETCGSPSFAHNSGVVKSCFY